MHPSAPQLDRFMLSDDDNRGPGPQEAPEDLHENNGYPAAWDERDIPGDGAAEQSAHMLSKPPSYDKVRFLLSKDNRPNYSILPQVVPSMGKFDNANANLENKLQAALQYYVRALDSTNGQEDDFVASIALVRSAFEDVRQARRHQNIRGIKDKNSILERRQDDTRPSLYTQEEKEKLDKAKARQAASNKWNDFRGRQRQAAQGKGYGSSNNTNSKGDGRKGKGKARGRSYSRGASGRGEAKK